MATLTRTTVDDTGVAVAANLTSAASGGDEVLNDDLTFLVIDNGDTASHTLTITAQVSSVTKENYGSFSISDITVSVPAGEQRIVSAPVASYNDSNGKIQMSYDAVTSVTIGAFKLEDF